MNKNKFTGLTAAAVFAALLCITAPFSVPIGTIPISLATFTVYLAASTLGWKWGTASVVCYLVLGFCGLPVFSGFAGGIEKLVGPTGGFLLGYIPCAVICGVFSDLAKRWHLAWNVIGMVLGTVACYACGLIWYVTLTGQTFTQGLAVCVLPFIAGDTVKIIAASLLSEALRSTVMPYVNSTTKINKN